MEEHDNPFSDTSNFPSISKLHLRDKVGPAKNCYRMTWKEIRYYAKDFLRPLTAAKLQKPQKIMMQKQQKKYKIFHCFEQTLPVVGPDNQIGNFQECYRIVFQMSFLLSLSCKVPFPWPCQSQGRSLSSAAGQLARARPMAWAQEPVNYLKVNFMCNQEH